MKQTKEDYNKELSRYLMLEKAWNFQLETNADAETIERCQRLMDLSLADLDKLKKLLDIEK